MEAMVGERLLRERCTENFRMVLPAGARKSLSTALPTANAAIAPTRMKSPDMLASEIFSLLALLGHVSRGERGRKLREWRGRREREESL